MPEIMTGAAVPPPTAAPAAAPSAAPTPSTSSGRAPAPSQSGGHRPPPPQPVSKPANDLKDAYSMLDALGASARSPSDAPPAEPEPTAPEPSPEPEPSETPPTAGEASAVARAGAGATQKKPLSAPELRRAFDTLKAKAEGLEKKVVALEGSQPDWEKHPERLKLTENLAVKEKRLAELEATLELQAYQESPAYQEKFLQPYVDAFMEGQAWAAQLEVTDSQGNLRAGKPEDFDAVMSVYARSPTEGTKLMQAMFGDQWPSVVYHAKETLRLNQTRTRAIDAQKKQAGELLAAAVTRQKQFSQEVAQTFASEIKSAEEKYPQWSQAADGDATAAELLARGKHWADVAFGKADVDPETGKVVKRSPQEKAKLDAAVRNKAAWFDLAIHQWNQARDLNKQYEQKLKQYEASEPGGGTGGRRATKQPLSTWDQVEADLRKRAA